MFLTSLSVFIIPHAPGFVKGFFEFFFIFFSTRPTRPLRSPLSYCNHYTTAQPRCQPLFEKNFAQIAGLVSGFFCANRQICETLLTTGAECGKILRPRSSVRGPPGFWLDCTKQKSPVGLLAKTA